MDNPFTLQLHPDAAKNFDEKAERLLSMVCKMEMSSPPGTGFQPDIHLNAQLGENDIIGEIETGMVDYRHRQVGKFFQHEGQTFGLVDGGFRSFEELAIRLQGTSTIRPYLSWRCILDIGFKWVQQRHLAQTQDSFTTFVLREAAKQVVDSEIWLPLSRVYIQGEFTIGKITFRTVTRKMLDDILEKTKRKLPLERMAEFEVTFSRTRSAFQGCAAATLKLIAEPERAQEVAEEEAEYSISALRFFHASNMTPYVRCCCTFAGAENVSRITALTVNSTGIVKSHDRIVPVLDSTWVLSGAEISRLRQMGLDALSLLFAKDDKSPFENDLMNAILIYSRNSLLDDPASRLIYVLSAVESVLLRDNNEPIQKNIGERLAFLVGLNVDERISVRNTASSVYSVRSAFLHHGHALDKMDTLELEIVPGLVESSGSRSIARYATWTC